jgi:6-phosphogluconate dehydrogenase
MEIGIVGLGRMGQIVAERTLDAGHDVVVYDVDA